MVGATRSDTIALCGILLLFILCSRQTKWLCYSEWLNRTFYYILQFVINTVAKSRWMIAKGKPRDSFHSAWKKTSRGPSFKASSQSMTFEWNPRLSSSFGPVPPEGITATQQECNDSEYTRRSLHEQWINKHRLILVYATNRHMN